MMAMIAGVCVPLFLSVCISLGSPFQYSKEGQSITIRGYLGPPGQVEIPHTIDGCPVTKIDQQAFRENLAVTSVVLPLEVTHIGDQAFWKSSCPMEYCPSGLMPLRTVRCSLKCIFL